MKLSKVQVFLIFFEDPAFNLVVIIKILLAYAIPAHTNFPCQPIKMLITD